MPGLERDTFRMAPPLAGSVRLAFFASRLGSVTVPLCSGPALLYCVGKVRAPLPIRPEYRAFERSFDVAFC